MIARRYFDGSRMSDERRRATLRTRIAVRLWSLVTGWTLSNAWDIWYVPAKASESPRGATSAWERSFWSQMASNSPKTNDFGAKRSVSRRPITVAVFRRAVRHHRAPPSQSARSSTPTRCPTVAESASAEKRRMVHAVLCGHVRASFGVPAASMSVNGLDCHRKPQDRRTECPGPPV